MRIIFIGQAAFGKEALQALVEQGESIAGVITVPDRGGQINPIKELTQKNNIPVIQPERLKDPDAVEWVKNLSPDLLVLAFVTQFVPKEMIDMSTRGGINYHPSLLPKYRGGSAINWAIISGETETGVTIHQIDEGVDTGPIILQEKVGIAPDDTVKSLYFKKLYPLGIKMVAKAVRLIREGSANPIPQDNAQASFQPVIKESDTLIDWSQPTQQVYNLIRGSNPSPGAVSSLQGERLKIWEGVPCPALGKPGEVMEILMDEGFVVSTGNGSILVQRVQYKDSGKISAVDFIKEFSLKIGDRLGS